MNPHEAGAVPEPDLVHLFRPRRVDPEAFRRGVDERIREKEAREPESRGDVDEQPNSFRSEFLRRAAALLPFDPTATTAGSAASLKVLSTALLLPFVAVLASVSAFAAGMGSVRRSVASAAPNAARPTRSKKSRGRFLIGSMLAQTIQSVGTLILLVPFLAGAAWALDLLVLVFLIATFSLVVVVRGLADSAQLTRGNVERFATMILMGLLFGAFLWMGVMHFQDSGSRLGPGWAAGAVVIGILCLPFAAQRALTWKRSVPRIVCVLAVVLVLNPIGGTNTSPASVRRQFEALHLDASNLANWREARHAYEALVAAHAELPDMRRIRAEVNRAFEQELSVHAAVWTSASRMGLVGPEQWRRLASRKMESYSLDQMLALRGPLHVPDYYAYRLPMLLAARTLTDEQREALALRIEASWPEPGRHDPLDQVVLVVDMLETLGMCERLERLRPRVHALLQELWVGESHAMFARIGGFTSDPVQFQTSFVPVTANAVELMDRFGVPKGIDLDLVQGNLRNESRAFPIVFELMPELRLPARAALLHLKEGIGLPPRTWIEWLLGERVLIASVLTVLLCFFAVRAAPADFQPARGALP